MNFIQLSDSELRIMEVLWAKEEPASFSELFEYFNSRTEVGWKKQTLNTFLFRMRQKKLLNIFDSNRYKMYAPSISQNEYLFAESKALLNKNYQGSIVKMLTAFGDEGKLEKEEIEELKRLIKKWEAK